MSRTKIAGIDYSLTSPAVCIYTEESDGGYFDFDRCVLHYLSNTKGQQQLAAGCGLENIKATPYPEWTTTEERHENLSDWKMKIPFTIFPPTVIKKHATGKGNADKQLMYNAFCDELLTPTDLKERLTPKAKKIISPISDIVDSYFIAKCGIDGVLG